MQFSLKSTFLIQIATSFSCLAKSTVMAGRNLEVCVLHPSRKAQLIMNTMYKGPGSSTTTFALSCFKAPWWLSDTRAFRPRCRGLKLMRLRAGILHVLNISLPQHSWDIFRIIPSVCHEVVQKPDSMCYNSGAPNACRTPQWTLTYHQNPNEFLTEVMCMLKTVRDHVIT